MNDFPYKSVCILGRQPALGLAELERLYGADQISPIDGAALLKIDAGDINFKNLGGTIKVARILSVIDSNKWNDLFDFLYKNIPLHLQYLPDGKFTLGLSTYGVKVDVSKLNNDMLALKRLIKDCGKPVRIVPNKELWLNSAQVLHNKLTVRGAWELIYIKYGSKTILAQTMFVQDIEDYAARDQARPKRDAKVGMLPPKLAQVLINLAAGSVESKIEGENKTLPKTRFRVLDPFCGTGVVLQEALLMGYGVIGTDLEPRMVEYSKKNIEWLVDKNPNIQGLAVIETGDATSMHWAPFSCVASEVYLGRPLNSLPAAAKLKEISSDVNTILSKFLRNLGKQMKPGQFACLAVPAWRRPNGSTINLPVLDKLTDMGYTLSDLNHVKSKDLIYFRENQVVARQILILRKK